MIDRVILKIREILHYVLHFNIYAGKGVILRGVPFILYGKNITFGKSVRLNEKVYLHAKNGIEIGDNTTLSYGVSVITESYDVSDYTKYLERHHSGAEIKIGRNVWIGANSTILPGVTIADNIIVGAGSVVNHSLTEEYCIYAGVPAIAKKRIDVNK